MKTSWHLRSSGDEVGVLTPAIVSRVLALRASSANFFPCKFLAANARVSTARGRSELRVVIVLSPCVLTPRPLPRYFPLQ
jgi:hypothetical protein